MASPGIIALISTFLVAASETKRPGSVLPYSECRWDELHSLNCSLTGMTGLPDLASQAASMLDLSRHPTGTLFWPESTGREWIIKHLDLSNNRISTLHLRVFYNCSALETLNANENRIHRVFLKGTMRPSKQSVKSSSDEFLTSLKALLLEKNRLKAVPKGLGKLQSLQTLCLSFNRILHIHRVDFQNCTELKRIYLQNNRISKIHPEAFSDIKKLQVLRLSSNALITIAPLVFMYTHVLQAEVDLSNNPWACDCRLLTLKHFMSTLFKDLGREWDVTCSAPLSMKGQHLLSTGDFPSTCDISMEDSVFFKSLILPAGIKSILPCDLTETRGSGSTFWWTPRGIVFEEDQDSHHYVDKMKHLVINLPRNSDEGLYVCVSNIMGRRIVYQVFVEPDRSLQRSPRDIQAVSNQMRTHQEFTVAVCLSVIISFISAFCLGVFTRPFIEKLWRKQCKSMCTKEQQSDNNSYENDGFTDETIPRGNSAGIAGNNHPYEITKSLRHHMYQNEPSSGNCIIAHDDGTSEQDSIVTECSIAIHRSYSPKYVNSKSKDGMLVMGREEEESSTINQQCIVNIPNSLSYEVGIFRDGKNKKLMDGKPAGLQKEVGKEKDNLHKTKHFSELETVGTTYENARPQINPECDVSDSFFATSSVKAADFISNGTIKNPKHKQLFPTSGSESPPQSLNTKEAVANNVPLSHNADFNTSIDVESRENDYGLHTGNSGFAKKEHNLDSIDNHLPNQEIGSVKDASSDCDNSSTDNGSTFSFNFSSSSLSDTTEVKEIPSDENILNIQPTSNAEELKTHLKHEEYSPSEHGSNSPNNLSTPNIARQDSFTSTGSSGQNDNIRVIEQQGTTDTSVRFRHQSPEAMDNHFFKGDLQIHECDNTVDISVQTKDLWHYSSDNQNLLQTNLFQDRPAGRVNNKSNILNEDLIFSPPRHQSNYATYEDQSQEDAVICTFDKNEHGVDVTVIPDFLETPLHLQIIPENTVYANNAPEDFIGDGFDSNKDTAILCWLDNNPYENGTADLQLPIIRSNIQDLIYDDLETVITTEKEQEMYPNLETHEGSTKPIVNTSPDIYSSDPRSVFGHSNGSAMPGFVKATSVSVSPDMDIDSSSLMKYPHISTQEVGLPKADQVKSDNTGGFFVKKKKVFDSFSASLKPDKN
ncbi:hypothetical protein FKM82_001481 [Ascaphus truei]